MSNRNVTFDVTIPVWTLHPCCRVLLRDESRSKDKGRNNRPPSFEVISNIFKLYWTYIILSTGEMQIYLNYWTYIILPTKYR